MADKADTSTATTLKSGQETGIAEVEAQLNDLWRQAVGSEDSEPVLRATTLNLLIDTDSSDAALRALDQIADRYPCRAILLIETEDPAAPLTATPALLLRPAFGREMRTQVTCELITLKVGKGGFDRLTSAAQGLTLSDHPTYFWKFWQSGDRFASNDPALRMLGETLDGLIVDSARFVRSEEGLRAVAALPDEETLHFHGDVYDLNWARLQGWRAALAQQFDAGEDRTAITSALSVEVEHKDGYAAAILLLGWLVDRLGWRVVGSTEPGTWSARSAAGTLKLRLKEQTTSAANDTPGVGRVTITALGKTYAVEYSSADGCFILTAGERRMVLASASLETTALINLALDTSGRDLLYTAALQQADRLIGETASLAQRAGIIVVEDADALSRIAARELMLIARQSIGQSKRFTLALSGGTTPRALYELLASEPYRNEIPWAQTHIFWGDERDVPSDNAESNQRMAREALLSRVPIPAENIHPIAAGSLTAVEAAKRYAADLRTFFALGTDDLPQFDLILLGLGDDGHTASLFPHTAALEAVGTELFIANAVPQLNTTRLTLTADVINNAAHVIFLVSGAKKADILYEVMHGQYRPDDHPAQRIHPGEGALTVIADQAAAARLRPPN